MEEELGSEEFCDGVLSSVFLWDISRDVNEAIKYVSLDQGSLSEHQKHPEGLIAQIAGPTPRVSDEGLGGACEFAFLTGSQVTLLLLVQGSHFKNYWSRQGIILGVWKSSS